MRIAGIYPVYVHKDRGVGYIAQSLLREMARLECDAELFCEAVEDGAMSGIERPVLTSFWRRIGYRLLSSQRIRQRLEAAYFKRLTDSDICDCWPGTSIALLEALKAAGHPVIVEMINSHVANARSLLGFEYERCGIASSNPITEQDIELECRRLALADLVASPSPEVTRSLEAAGVPASKVIRSSFGLRESEIFHSSLEPRSARRDSGIVAVFLGRIGIRKGCHRLFEYWAKAGRPGVLKLVGGIESEFQSIAAKYINHRDIVHVPYTLDVHSELLGADLFILPSVEEGSPLVTYQAMGTGLPCMVTPMGGGGVVEDGRNGTVLQNGDPEVWANEIRRYANDRELRVQYGLESLRIVQRYTWSEVAKQRVRLLKESLATL